MKKTLFLFFYFFLQNYFVSGQSNDSCIYKKQGLTILISKEKKANNFFSTFVNSDLIFCENINTEINSSTNIDSIISSPQTKWIILNRKDINYSSFYYNFMDSLSKTAPILNKSGFRIYTMKSEIYCKPIKKTLYEYRLERTTSISGSNVKNTNNLLNCLLVFIGIKIPN